jgi:hypothetical protein
MTVKKADMMRLTEQRDKLLAEIEALKNKATGIEMAISLLEGDTTSSTAAAKSGSRGKVKGVVLDLLREVGTTGLNATTALEIAGRRGFLLDRGSVSSLLSRLKKDGVVVYDGEFYRLPEYAPETHRPPERRDPNEVMQHVRVYRRDYPNR